MIAPERRRNNMIKPSHHIFGPAGTDLDHLSIDPARRA